MKQRSLRRILIFAALCLLPAAVGHGAGTQSLQRPTSAGGTIIVPDRFLRRWDPVTVFFRDKRGPRGGGAEDKPGRYVEFAPDHPGAFTWIDEKTLQFRPAEPWPPLARFNWKADGKTLKLTTLMAAPTQTIPRSAADGLDPVEQITLTFPEPLDIEALRRMVTIELRPLPGIAGERARFLTREDFKIKPMERRSRSDTATYVLALASPIPLGTRAIVRLRLSLDDDARESFAEVAFATAEPFRVLRVGCGSQRYPITPEGSRYTRDQALNCGSRSRTVRVEFSAAPSSLGPVEGRNLIRFTPAVEDLKFSLSGRSLDISGDFDWDTVYQVGIAPHPVTDRKGRVLELSGSSEVYVYFPRKSPYLKWNAAHGVVERNGPKMVPVEGRGAERVDLRVYPVDPLDRNFWPFPERNITVDESHRPPGPGEEPEPHVAPNMHINASQLTRHISALGSPPVSKLVRLPLRKEGSSASFGLDVGEHLGFLSGNNAPGHYLIGLRQLDRTSQRSWMRIQVTDLSLTTMEESRNVRFLVTSLSSGKPVAGADVKVEGARDRKWVTVVSGRTDSSGTFEWTPSTVEGRDRAQIRRLVVTKGTDVLVLDATRPTQRYANNHWSDDRQTWLQWTQTSSFDARSPQAADLCHLFTERPVYRPEEKVHIKGYLRTRKAGTLNRLKPVKLHVVVDGPGDLAWRYPVETTSHGSFYQLFNEEKLPSGTYSVRLESKKHRHPCSVSFKKEAYRVPRFEVKLHGPDRVPLDREFEVKLSATYYAGGKVGGQDVEWRVTQFPYTWRPGREEGFLYSSDRRFSGADRFESSGQLNRVDVTGDDGGAALVLNPAIEPTAQPRSYVVEATVTGADDMIVSSTRRVVALPPFVLGLKLPRFLEKATKIRPQVVVVDHAGNKLAGQEVTMRLLHRQWHSHLRASDFSDGVARYITDVVDEKILEKKIVSTKDVLTVPLEIERAGVYIVELESHDRLGRAQVVSMDLYAGGDEPVTWERPPTRVFEVATDKDSYEPGETARFLLKSPFQRARALAVIEAPEGNRYEWIDVRGGSATFRLPVKRTYVPDLPVHFVLMRGRIAGTAPLPGSKVDLGKPATMAATQWMKVQPVENQVKVTLDYPEKAQPGDKVKVKIALADNRGRPLDGEVALWFVDQAVLALGTEQRLDPVPDFITDVRSYLNVHDTRNLAFGRLAFSENPGGDDDYEDEKSAEADLLDKVTVRRRFESVPYFNPAIRVPSTGTTTVTVSLPDNLTNFKIRAKAVHGSERFGFGKGQLAVRLPVIVQPALPRFVRPGDSFVATAIGRIVEGGGGAGKAQLRANGVTAQSDTKQSFTWDPKKPQRVSFPVKVTDPPYKKDGTLSYEEVSFTIGVERTADKARDAFQVNLPIRDDRRRVRLREMKDLTAKDSSLELPALPEPARPGTLKRSVLASDQPGLIRMAAGLDFLMAYPYGCTEQRLSRARAQIALKKFRTLLAQPDNNEALDKVVKDTLDWIPQVVDDNGLVAYWPGSPGYVSLTAWVTDFLVEAKEAGYHVDEKILSNLTRTLERALRSDYSHFIDGESWSERAFALSALANTGKFNSSYAAELARKSKYLDLEGVAQVLLAFDRAKTRNPKTVDPLTKELWEGLIFRLHQGGEIYGGLQDRRSGRSGLILPTETRTLAEVSRALTRYDGKHNRHPVLVAGLVTLGRGDGWGSTNANASALLALSEVLEPPFTGAKPHAVTVKVGATSQRLATGPSAPVATFLTQDAAAGKVTLASGTGPYVVRVETTYIPAGDGSTVTPKSKGFVVTRELLKVAKTAGEPMDKIVLEQAGKTVSLAVGDVVEDHVQIVNPKPRHYVAVFIPLAAGMEPLNPNLETSPAEATPSSSNTLRPTYASYMDDHVAFYYNTLPKGTYNFYFRTRSTIEGSYTQPPARAEMMYDGAVFGNSAGAKIKVERAAE